jgi:hypothetical protein
MNEAQEVTNLEKRTRKVSEYRTLPGGVAIFKAWEEWQAAFADSAEVWEFAKNLVELGLAPNVHEALPMAFKAPKFKDKGLKLSTCSPAELQKLVRAAILRTDIDTTAVLTAVVRALVDTMPAESVSIARDRVTKLAED